MNEYKYGSILDETHFFECQCGSDEHTLRFIYDKEHNEVYLSIFLNNPRFCKRIWLALKYVFGYKCKHGHWDNWLMHRGDASRLIYLLEKLENKDDNSN